MSNPLAMGPFQLSTSTRELSGPGVSVVLGDRAFNILRVLAERQEQVVPKRELLRRVWPDTTVDEAALRFQILNLRRILSGSQAPEVRILNAAGRGYMLTVGERQQREDGQAPFHNLPQRDIRLIGRDEEIADIAARLRSVRLVTLAGPGGVGKTSIALAIGSKLLGDFPQVFWVDFSSVEDPSKALVTAATTLQITPGGGDPTAFIVAHLRREPALLVLDNCEHVSEQAAHLADSLLNETTTARVLATSREPLRVSQEHVYRVRPLTVPSIAEGREAAAALEYSAIELFVRSAVARSGYELVDGDVRFIATICRHLDGMPLAIELAASWMEAFTPRQLAENLQAHLLRAEGGPWDVSARHRSLEAMLQWSYERLKPALRTQFASLAVFRGEFDLNAAVEVTGGDRGQAIAGLAELVAKSLVDVRRTDEGAAYRLLFVARAYAEEKLKQAGAEKEARRRHANVVLSWLREFESAPTSAAQLPEWLVKYGPIADDLRAATDWASSSQGELELAGRLAHEGTLAWFRLSLAYEGAQYLTQTLKQLALRDERDPALELKLKTDKAILMLFSADWNIAELPDIDQETNRLADRTTLQLIFWCHWVSAYRSRRYREALDYALQFGALSDPKVLIDQLAAERMISSCYLSIGPLEEARRGLQRVIETAAVGTTAYSAATRYQYDQTTVSLIHLAHVLWMLGDADGARAAAVRSVAVAETTRHKNLIAFALHAGLAHIAILNGDPDEADEALDRLSPYVADRNVDKGAADAFKGAALALRGRHAEAAAWIRRSFDAGGVQMAWSSALLGLVCEIVGRAGDPEFGLARLEEALRQFHVDPEDTALPELRRAKAALLVMARGASAKAEALALLDDALSQSRAQASRGWEARILAERARVLEFASP